MVPIGDRSRSADRIGVVEAGIGGGDRDFGNDGCVEGVAEVDDTGNAVSVVLVDEDVPVVCVIMDDGGAQHREPRGDPLVEAVEKALEKSTILEIGHMCEPTGRTSGIAYVPVEVAQCARMHEALERGIEAAEHPAEGVKRSVAAIGLRERSSRNPGDQPQSMDHPAPRGRREVRTGQCRLQMRDRQVPCIFAGVLQQRCLEVAFDFRLGAVDDLQNVAAALAGIDLEVLVPLAVQRLK